MAAIAALLPQKDAHARLIALERTTEVDPARVELTRALLDEMTTTLWLPMTEAEVEAISAALSGVRQSSERKVGVEVLRSSCAAFEHSILVIQAMTALVPPSHILYRT